MTIYTQPLAIYKELRELTEEDLDRLQVVAIAHGPCDAIKSGLTACLDANELLRKALSKENEVLRQRLQECEELYAGILSKYLELQGVVGGLLPDGDHVSVRGSLKDILEEVRKIEGAGKDIWKSSGAEIPSRCGAQILDSVSQLRGLLQLKKVSEPQPKVGEPALCHSARDGECSWKWCPQNIEGEPARSGRHCPLWRDGDEDGGYGPIKPYPAVTLNGLHDPNATKG